VSTSWLSGDHPAPPADRVPNRPPSCPLLVDDFLEDVVIRAESSIFENFDFHTVSLLNIIVAHDHIAQS
jgi:hypothetical protein